VRRSPKALVCATLVCFGAMATIAAKAEPNEQPIVDRSSRAMGSDGKWVLPNGEPTYDVKADGTVDWFTYAGYGSYRSECGSCHGIAAGGTSFAPRLAKAGRRYDVKSLLSKLGSIREDTGGYRCPTSYLHERPEVMCHVEEIAVYLAAVSDGAVTGERPNSHASKTSERQMHLEECYRKYSRLAP
jgi:hypothetical protein